MNANRIRWFLLLALVCVGIASGCQSSRQLEQDVREELDPRSKWLERLPNTGDIKQQQRTQNEVDFRAGNLGARTGSR